jgi:hypothetical protein
MLQVGSTGINQPTNYMDDIFVISLHGPDRFRDFLDHQNILFTSEAEIDGQFSFLDILMQRARAHCYQNNLRNELDFLNVTLRQEDYRDPQILRAECSLFRASCLVDLQPH